MPLHISTELLLCLCVLTHCSIKVKIPSELPKLSPHNASQSTALIYKLATRRASPSICHQPLPHDSDRGAALHTLPLPMELCDLRPECSGMPPLMKMAHRFPRNYFASRRSPHNIRSTGRINKRRFLFESCKTHVAARHMLCAQSYTRTCTSRTRRE